MFYPYSLLLIFAWVNAGHIRKATPSPPSQLKKLKLKQDVYDQFLRHLSDKTSTSTWTTISETTPHPPIRSIKSRPVVEEEEALARWIRDTERPVNQVSVLTNFLEYTSLGEEQLPNELIPNAGVNGKKTMSPIGDQHNEGGECCGDPAVFPNLPPRPRDDVPKQHGSSEAITAAILGDIEAGDPVKLKKALAELKQAPIEVKEEVSHAMEKEQEIAKEVAQTPPTPPPTLPALSLSPSPSPSPTAEAPPPDIGDDRVGGGTTDDEPMPLTTPSPSSKIIEEEKMKKEMEIEERKENLADAVLDNPALLISGHPTPAIDEIPFVRKITFAEEIRVVLSPKKKIIFMVEEPVSERAPGNLHFVATFRDQEGTGCGGLTMRLRKHCGDSQTDPELCTLPFLTTYSETENVPRSIVREKKMRNDVLQKRKKISTDGMGGVRTLEWFEENHYTRRNRSPSWNCGCRQSELDWTAPRNILSTWWIELDNVGEEKVKEEKEEEARRRKASGDTIKKSCQFSFRAHFVDICSGHGEWIQSQGCRCDQGYFGQYQGPMATRRKDGNMIVEETLLEIESIESATNLHSRSNMRSNARSNARSIARLRGNQQQEPHKSLQTRLAQQTPLSVAEVMDAIGAREGRPAIETTPNELGGADSATQDSHNLGCTRDDRAPMRDGRVEKMLVMARASVGKQGEGKEGKQSLSTRAGAGDVGGRSTEGNKVEHDDCFGTLTANSIDEMTDEEVVGCTGRSREEVLAGTEYNRAEDDEKAMHRRSNRTTVDPLDDSGWLLADDEEEKQLVVVGEVGADELGEERRRREERMRELRRGKKEEKKKNMTNTSNGTVVDVQGWQQQNVTVSTAATPPRFVKEKEKEKEKEMDEVSKRMGFT